MGDVLTVAELSRAVVAEVAPVELGDFDEVVDAYASSPGAARRAGSVANQPAAAGVGLAGEAMSTLILAVSSDMAKNILVTGSPWPIRPWDPRGWFRRAPKPHDPVPPTSAPPESLAAAAMQEARTHRGVDEALARSVAGILVRDWPRLS